jgi:glycosyltransferase involved in cell wall biosynthesis
MKFAEANADFRIYQTEFARRNIHRVTKNSPESDYTIIHNGVVFPDVVSVDKEDKPFVSISHNWIPFRNHNYLNVMFKNLPAIVEAHPDFKWWIVGNYQELYQKALVACPDYNLLTKHVKFHQFTRTPNDYRMKAGACIHIVGRDACPNSLIESMSYGLPCITWEESGGAELVRNNECGVVIGDFEAKTIIDAISDIKKNYRDYGLCARLNGVRNLHIDEIVEQYAEVFRKLF